MTPMCALLVSLAISCSSKEPDRLRTKAPLGTAPDDPLHGSNVSSCPVYQAEVCDGGNSKRCEIFDTATMTFVDNPSPLLERAYLYDRWYDLFHQPDGQTVNRVFRHGVAAGTAEAEWGAPEQFDSYHGTADTAIWTGTALTAFAARYLNTGTEADYQRMEKKTRQLLTLFDVTGIDGYLARNHYLLLEHGAPSSDEHIMRYAARDGDGVLINDDHREHVITPEVLDAIDLPEIYRAGVEDDSGTVWTGTPTWRGNPSIDQYSGSMVSLPLVHALLRDDALKEKIEHQLICYLHRLERIEIRNLQENAEARRSVESYINGGLLELSDNDVDLTELDTIVAYALRQTNSTNTDTFDPSCPDFIATEPSRILDAASNDLILQLLVLMADGESKENERPGGLDHFYVPSIRAGDAVHLMHLTTMAYHFTGDRRYENFLFDELIGNLDTIRVASTAGAFALPRWCTSYYGHHISFTPLWAFINLLDEVPLREQMQRVMEEKVWRRVARDLGNAKFDLLYVTTVPPLMASEAETALTDALTAIRTLGGNGGVLTDPRRTYTLDRATVIANMPEGNRVICPTPLELEQCTAGFEFLGIQIPGDDITRTCGGPNDCPTDDGCARGMAEQPMPMEYRKWEDFIWQRNPFEIGSSYSIEGQRQSPGLDLIEPYWVARHYGFITAGRGSVLAWRETGSCP